MVPVVVNKCSVSAMRGTASMISRASGGTNTAWGCLFLVLAGGRLQTEKSSLSSDHLMPLTSRRRCPVRSSSFTTGPNGKPISPQAFHSALTSASLKTLARADGDFGRNIPMAGLTATRRCWVAQLNNLPRAAAIALPRDSLGIAVDARLRSGDAAASRLGDHGVDRDGADVADRLGSPSSGETARQQLWLVAVLRVVEPENSRRVAPAAVSRAGVVRDELLRHGREGGAASALPRQLDLRLGDVDALRALAQQLVCQDAGGSQRERSAEGWVSFVARREVERAERHLALPAVRPAAAHDPRLVARRLDEKTEARRSAVANLPALLGVRSQSRDCGVGQQLRQGASPRW